MECVNLSQITNKKRQRRTGHVIYAANLVHSQRAPQAETARKIFYKENKHHCTLASQMEVSFSGLATRFLKPHLTARQTLVKDNAHALTGVISEHLCYAVQAREGDKSRYYTVDGGCISAQAKSCTKETIPVYFFNDLPGFFTALTRDLKGKALTFDMASLASVLATSYTLEEDDLHKGNFGFYLVEKEGKPHVVFMKIDHDLMMADSVMSHGHARVANWFYQRDAFSITARDLLHFPKLLDSKNHYWPTSRRWLVNPGDPKIYRDDEEMTAFAALAKNEDFIKAKWQEFYKHTLISPQLIWNDASLGFDPANATDRAQIALITNAVVARQARLRAVLFSIEPFRQYIAGLSEEDKKQIKQELLGSDNETGLTVDLDKTMAHHHHLCTTPDKGFKPGDTPFHTAIRLDDYRYDETWKAFGQFAKQNNQDGESPMQLAINQAMVYEAKQNPEQDPRKNPLIILKHVLKKTVKHHQIEGIVDDLSAPYTQMAGRASDLNGLMVVLREVGEDTRYSLKLRKGVAIHCLKSFIANQQNNPVLNTILTEFRDALNVEKRPELQYIRQLRSELWIIRQIRGLLGGTRTQCILTRLADEALGELRSQATGRHGFFNELPLLKRDRPPKPHTPSP